jgi:hypothetical protein
VEPAERPSVAPKGRAEAAERPATNDRSGRSRDGREFEDREGAAERERSYELSNSSTRGRGREQRDRYEHDGGDRGKRAPHYAQGKVAKVKPYNNGYRVWIHGSSHPYYVPQAYWRPGYFNVGMTVRVGGYYNPSGWYDYYGDYECNTISEQRMRGIVEDVDYRRGELLLDMVGGGYVTIDVSHRREPVRPGDYVVVYGNWNRWGRFVALDVDIIDRAYRW